MNESNGIGLRERKRAQTADAIHVAAAELALERGLEDTTIDAISERADVSTRTFFNYFHSKEDAALGIDTLSVDIELDRAKLNERSGDLIRDVFELVFVAFQASGGMKGKTELRMQVIHRFPQLVTRQMLRVTELEDRLCTVIVTWLETNPRFAGDTAEQREQDARILLGICFSTVRHAMKNWTGGDTIDPRAIYERAIDALTTLMEKLK